MAIPAILVTQNVFTVFDSWSFGRCCNHICNWRLTVWQHACAEHDETQQAWLVRRLHNFTGHCRLAAQIGDQRLYILVAQVAPPEIRHDEQPAPIAVYTIADGAENLAVRPILERTS